MNSFQLSKSCLNYEDFKCLLDHLCKESCQLLRKSDRCKLLLKIINIDNNDEVERYCDLLIGLLLQLSQQDDELKFDLSCQVLEKRRRSDNYNGNEEIIYQWMEKYVEKNPEKEIQFYSIKLKHDENRNEDKSNVNNQESYNANNQESYHCNSSNYFHSVSTLMEDDLQKLKIFESFQM